MPSDSLVSSRRKRSNAGSKLQQLLREEKLASGISPGDLDDVDLLFEEDENDLEFNEGDDVESHGPANEISEEEDEEEEQEEGEVENNEPEDEDSDAQVAADSDEMFSDSESNESSDDSDEGEKELQKQERQKRKQKMKKARQIQSIKKATPSIPKIKKKYSAPEAETLLSETRRQSSRTTVVQNKLELVERLREEEVRRASVKPVAKVVYHEMTQEERLAEALETEKYNTSTLNKYQEQEIEKKKKQRALQLSKRKKLNDVVSFKTFPKFVEISEELELEKFLITRDKLKKKDRRGRKSEKQKREELEARLAEEKKRQRLEELTNDGDAKRIRLDDSLDVKRENVETQVTAVDDHIVENDETDVTKEHENAVETESKQEDVDNTLIKTETEDVEMEPIEDLSKKLDSDLGEAEGVKPEEDGAKESIGAKEEREIDISESVELVADVKKDNPEIRQAEDAASSQTLTQENDDINNNDIEIKTAEKIAFVTETKPDETQLETKVVTGIEEGSKSVKFVDEITEPVSGEPNETVVISSSRETTLEPSEPVEEIVYEGPLQKVGINLILFESKLKQNELKSFLFGPDSNLGPSRRFKDLEPLIHIQKAENEFQQFQSLDSKLEFPDFSILDNQFPKFGEFNKVKTQQIIPEVTQDIKIQLTTPAPTGIYLPNGNKKMCLITGKPAMYFDPKTGMPYSSVESYKVIKRIQEGKFAWGDFRKGGCYFEDLEEVRHAKGVPEGFGG